MNGFHKEETHTNGFVDIKPDEHQGVASYLQRRYMSSQLERVSREKGGFASKSAKRSSIKAYSCEIAWDTPAASRPQFKPVAIAHGAQAHEKYAKAKGMRKRNSFRPALGSHAARVKGALAIRRRCTIPTGNREDDKNSPV